MKSAKNELNKYFEYINKNIPNVLEIKLVSRLLIKNLVFYVRTLEEEFAVKFYVKDLDKNFETEITILKFFNKNHIINVAELVRVDSTLDVGNVLVMKWINGNSLKKIIKENDFCGSRAYLTKMLEYLSKIWLCDFGDIEKDIKKEVYGIDDRLGLSQDEIFSSITKLKPNINFKEIFSLYLKIKEEMKQENFLINYDLSAHEYIVVGNTGYFIDFERFRIGDPNNDLARMFQSCTNGIYKDKQLFLNIYKLFCNNQFFKKKNFCFYLIEKLLCSIFVAADELADEQIDTYIEFIFTLYK